MGITRAKPEEGSEVSHDRAAVGDYEDSFADTSCDDCVDRLRDAPMQALVGLSVSVRSGSEVRCRAVIGLGWVDATGIEFS